MRRIGVAARDGIHGLSVKDSSIEIGSRSLIDTSTGPIFRPNLRKLSVNDPLVYDNTDVSGIQKRTHDYNLFIKSVDSNGG